ncbi:MAG: MscL family protein [Betaproteobacteria bacterium]
MSIAREFREFAVKGNVVDLAVGVIIGAAFGKGLVWQIGDARIQYGNFVQNIVDFVIIAWAIFVAVKVINRLRKKDEEKPPAATPPRQERLLEEIRDLLKSRPIS